MSTSAWDPSGLHNPTIAVGSGVVPELSSRLLVFGGVCDEDWLRDMQLLTITHTGGSRLRFCMEVWFCARWEQGQHRALPACIAPPCVCLDTHVPTPT